MRKPPLTLSCDLRYWRKHGPSIILSLPHITLSLTDSPDSARWLRWAKQEARAEHQETWELLQEHVILPPTPDGSADLDGTFTLSQLQAILYQMVRNRPF